MKHKMFKGLKKIWQQAKKNVNEAEEFIKDDGVIRMPPAGTGYSGICYHVEDLNRSDMEENGFLL